MEIIHHHFESIGSTNDWVKANLKSLPEKDLLVVTADSQWAAKGQYGRKWICSKNENIYASFGFFIEQHQDPILLTLVLALSAVKTLQEYGVPCQIKWPNDLLADKKKIGGILCETEPFPHKIGVTLGIGLNVNMTQELLKDIDQPATSIFLETHIQNSIQEIFCFLREDFVSNLHIFLQKGFSPFVEQYNHHKCKKGACGIYA